MARPDTWFRMYAEVVDDPKVQQLPDKLFKIWVNLLCIATRNGGTLPSYEDVAFKLRITPVKAREHVETFLQRALFDQSEDGIAPHNWKARQYKSDVSTDRVKRFRERSGNVSHAVSETPTEQSIAEQTEAKASVARKPRRTRLANDWQPSAEDHACAVSEGLTEPEIAADLAEWREYWCSSEPRDPTKRDWSRTYRNHVKQFAPGIIARRVRGGQSRSNRPGVASVLAAGAAVLSRLENQPGFRPDGSADLEGHADDAGSTCDGEGGGAGGQVIDGTCEPQRNNLAAYPPSHRNEDAA